MLGISQNSGAPAFSEYMNFNSTHCQTQLIIATHNCHNSMDANQWTGIKSGRQRASSVWSANSTALRVSIAKALNQKNNLIATSRRPTTTTLLSVNPSGLRNGKVTKGQIKPKADWRAVDSPKKTNEQILP